MGYRCVCCNKNVNDGDKVYFIDFISKVLEPVCSVRCFEMEKERIIKFYKRRIERIEKMQPKEDVWD